MTSSMTNQGSRLRLWLAAATMSMLSLLTVALDRASQLTSARLVAHDLLSPGRLVLLSFQPAESPAAAPQMTLTAEDAHRLQTALKDSERQRRQLIIDNARLRNELRNQAVTAAADLRLSPYGAAAGNRLADYSIVSAQVISTTGFSNQLKHAILDAGSALGVTRSELVIDASGLLLDQGSSSGVAAGDRVLTGAVLIGRIARTSRWVSLLQPITDRDFSARVQLLRRTTDGDYMGAIGILKGTGELECRIEGIPYTEAVTVGDEVVTADIDGLRGPPLYVGQVTRAEFLDGGQWQIQVCPAMTATRIDRAGIVRTMVSLPKQDLTTNSISTVSERSGMP